MQIKCLTSYTEKILSIKQQSDKFQLFSSNQNQKIKKTSVCISCTNGFQTVNIDNLLVNFNEIVEVETNDGVPQQLFIVQNYPYTQKLGKISSFEVKKDNENLEITFDQENSQIEIKGLKKGDYDVEAEVETTEKEIKIKKIKIMVADNFYT